MRRSAALATSPRKKLPWNFHQARMPTATPTSPMPVTPRVSINKENMPDNGSESASNNSSAGLVAIKLFQPAASPGGPVKSASASRNRRSAATSQQTPSARQQQQQSPMLTTQTPSSQEFEVMTCSGLLKEVLASAAATQKQKKQQQSKSSSATTSAAASASSPDHLIAIRQLAAQLASKVAHRPDCLALLSELDQRLDQLSADIALVAGQFRDENRVLRRRIRQLERESSIASSQSESTVAAAVAAAAAASQSEAAWREWGRREAQLLARLQAAETAKSQLETRSAALETELREMSRQSRPVSVVSNAASNDPTAAVASPLTAANLARHTNRHRLMEMKTEACQKQFVEAENCHNGPTALANEANNDGLDDNDDYAITSVSQQVRHPTANSNMISNSRKILPPPAATSSPPTLDTSPAPHLISVPARRLPPVSEPMIDKREQPIEDRQNFDDLDNLGDVDQDSDDDDDDDEAEFRRGLARIEEQIARLHSSLGGGGGLKAIQQ